jgi:hypothetical protein
VRRALVPLLTLLVTAGVVGLTPVAQASSTSAKLEIKGPGSVYTVADEDQHFITLPASAGSAVSFAAKVINTGTTTAQFKLYAGDTAGPGGGTVVYTVGGTVANGLINQPSGFYTPAIAPGKSVAITIKMTLDKTTPQADVLSELELDSSDGTQIDRGEFDAILKAPSTASGPAQVFVRNGSAAYVGGPEDFYSSTGPSLAIGGSTTFTAHVVNGWTGPDVVDVTISDTCTNYLISVKAGSTDVTSRVLGGTYSTPSIAVNGHLDLTVKVTYLGPRAGVPCDSDILQVQASSENFGGGGIEYLLANPAA